MADHHTTNSHPSKNIQGNLSQQTKQDHKAKHCSSGTHTKKKGGVIIIIIIIVIIIIFIPINPIQSRMWKNQYKKVDKQYKKY
jgi:predicted metalloprotease